MEPRRLAPYARLSPTLLQKDLFEKTILITGGGYGVGASIATSFAEARVRAIILLGRTESKLKASAQSLSSRFADIDVSYFKADVTSKDDVKGVFGTLKERNIVPDILVNNAGYLSERGDFVQADLDEYWESFNTNVLGTILVTQAFLQHRRATISTSSSAAAAAKSAVVITLNTVGAYTVHVPGLSAYGASKAAIARWSELIADDVPATEARFVSVHPGYVKTDMAAKSGLEGVFEPTEAKLAGDFVVWLTGEEAGFLNGRFVWANWDVDELVQRKGEIVQKDLLRGGLVA
ncbi:hypothetical protein BJX70DRAFT_385184 [Aspergillus crustosus]